MVGYGYEARPYRTQSHAIPDIRYEYSNSLIGIANIISYMVYAYIYTIILLMDSVSLSVLLIWGLYRPSSEPIALRNVLKCPTRHTLHIIRFWHFSSAALIVKKLKNAVLRHRSVNEFCEFCEF